MTVALAAAVAIAFSDSSIVVLALPELYVHFRTSIVGVSWVITAYNLVVAVAALALIPFVGRFPRAEPLGTAERDRARAVPRRVDRLRARLGPAGAVRVPLYPGARRRAAARGGAARAGLADRLSPSRRDRVDRGRRG